MSSPFPPGPPSDPEPREPGEQSPYTPYGAPAPNPYAGAPASPYGPVGTGPSTDAVSITGFVLSLLCCTSVVGLVLGLVGLGRTKNGVRKGRWAAVSAIAIGAAGTLAFVGIVGFFTWFGTSTVFIDSADVGQCVNVDELDDNDATLFKKDCDEPHEAEIAVARQFTGDDVDNFEPGFPAAVCEEYLNDEYAAAYATGTYDVGLVFEATEPDAGDDFICYLELANGDELEEPIVD
ncbi:hypothetical protein DJ010_18675 [Nocardioides silvaticus]|uniref:DUF4190 domain-containing protein n=1 Tax=Nocardioides silvaticus TaxID=2201891 RepID=A0A316TE92_9ACTN|nr:hypothetical protein [Nocardioides silvaticus]PWN01565.1 hypothetical protein DJ010_18675 [Nocardioides silvaticus]